MSVIADVTVPADAFALQHALSDHDVTIEAERLATHSPEWALPFLWATAADDDLDAFHDAMQRDPTVDDASVVQNVDGEALFQVHWSDDVIELLTEMIDQHAIILEAEATGDDWRFEIRFAEEGQVSTFQKHFNDRGRTFGVNRIYHPSAPRQREYGLTPEQRDALATAAENGYFSVPRESSMEELADELGISANAASQRIRRGSGSLVRHTLTIDSLEDAEEP